MHVIAGANRGCAANWWIRDANTSLPVIANLALGLQNLGKNVLSLMYWDAGHGANEDAAGSIAWIGAVTGYAA